MAGTAAAKAAPEVNGTDIYVEPPIVTALKKAGVELGHKFREVHAVDSPAMTGCAVVGIYGPASDIIIVFREVGTKNESIIPWRHITKLVKE